MKSVHNPPYQLDRILAALHIFPQGESDEVGDSGSIYGTPHDGGEWEGAWLLGEGLSNSTYARL